MYTPEPGTPLLQSALNYAKRDIPVFPCEGKSPLTPHGFKNATTDPHQIAAWWTEWPEANIAVPTGQRSGVLVLDIDRDKGGFESINELLAKYGKLPPTAVVGTGGGGLHIYFKHPKRSFIPCSIGKLGPGIDVKADGGYVLVPPSKTEDAYERLS